MKKNKARDAVINHDQLMPPAIILCGGQGTRIRDVTDVVPKPMVPVGPHPIVWHIMKIYASYGVKRFILCLGYKRESFINYFLNYRARATDITVRLQTPDNITYHGDYEEDDWEVTLANTGEATMTGGRVARAARYLHPSDKHCFLTYGDGLSDVNISDLLDHHLSHDRALTVTAVHPASRYGEMRLEKDRVVSFHEKPQTDTGLINGGYMVLRRKFIEQYLTEDTGTVLEETPMRSAVNDGQMSAYVHEGFWQCMDTVREHQMLNHLWDKGEAPWTASWPTSKMSMRGGGSLSPVTPASKEPGLRIGFAA